MIINEGTGKRKCKRRKREKEASKEGVRRDG